MYQNSLKKIFYKYWRKLTVNKDIEKHVQL